MRNSTKTMIAFLLISIAALVALIVIII